jgi:hypothetical protein
MFLRRARWFAYMRGRTRVRRAAHEKHACDIFSGRLRDDGTIGRIGPGVGTITRDET